MSTPKTELKKIQVYVSENELKQFRIVSAHNNLTMSKNLRKMIQDEIKKFQEKTK